MYPRAFATALSFLAGGVLFAQSPPEFLDVPVQVGPTTWQLTWQSEPGRIYRLDRSFDLLTWIEIDTVTASATTTTLADNGIVGTDRAFWRVGDITDDPGSSLVLGDVLVSYNLDGPGSTVTYSVTAGGTELVESVRFFDDGVPVGDAQPLFGTAWGLTLPWEPSVPRIHRLDAEAMTEAGTVERTEVESLLLADPARFVPLSTEGLPLYGQLIPANAIDALGPFRYYPEGIGSPGRTTGAHFEFAPGARVATLGAGSPVEVTFQAAKFHRGSEDTEPVETSGASRTLDLNDVTTDAVAQAFGLPPGPIDLKWGSSSVAWEGGALGEGGWSELQVELPLGDFGLPTGRFNAGAMQHPVTGERYLVVCYYGEWTPGAEGFVLRIPQADPLKIYLNEAGEFAAHGTAEAEFPSGAKVRGTIAWRRPVFEFRFEGKGITIPALDGLRDLLPVNPEDCVPLGNSASELDELAACLEGYRDTFRGLATGGTTHADPAGADSFAPLPNPSDQAVAALAAWAGRLASWAGDRAGETLDDAQRSALTQVVTQAAKTAEAAHRLPTILKILREFRRVQQHVTVPAGNGPAADALLAAVDDAEARVLQSLRRHVEAQPEFDPETGFNEVVALFEEVLAIEDNAPAAPARAPADPEKSAADSPAPRKGPAAAGFATRDACQLVAEKARDGLFAKYDIFPGDTLGIGFPGGQGNPHFAAADRATLTDYLYDLREFLDLLICCGSAIDAVNSPGEYPLEEAFSQLKPFLLTRHNTFVTGATLNQDYAQLQEGIRERADIIETYEAAGLPIAPTSFVPSNLEVVNSFGGAIGSWLDRLDPGARQPHFQENLDLIGLLASVAQEPALTNLLGEKWTELSHYNNRYIDGEFGSECDAFLDALIDRGYDLPFLSPAFETNYTVPITGKYESTNATGTPVTLQINQAGRYVVGWLQYARGQNLRLRGHFLDEQPDRVEFAVLEIAQNDFIDGDAKIVGERVNGEIRVRLEKTVRISGLPQSVQATVFLQTTNYPVFSPEVVAFFGGGLGEIVGAHQMHPLHSRLLGELEPLFAAAEQHIIAYADNPAGQAVHAANLNSVLGDMLMRVDPDSYPLLRLRFLQVLSQADLHTVGGVTRTLRDRFMIMLINNPNELANPDDATRRNGTILMGGEITGQTGGGLFTYDIKITQVGVTGEAGVGLGAFDLDIEIVKTPPGGSPLAPFKFDGWLAQAGLGPGIKVGLTGTQDTVTVQSPFDYQLENFEGPIMSLAASAAASGGTGVTISDAAAVFYGNGELPAMIVPTGQVDDPNFTLGIALSAGIEVAAGMVTGENNVDSSTDLQVSQAIRNFSAEEEAQVQSAFDFATDDFELSECGRQYLREFVAEHRAILAHPGAKVAVLGFTDTTASDAYNLNLSQQRAEEVRTTLLRILGNELRLPDANVVAIGLGEGPAKIGFPPDGEDPPDGHWLLDVPVEYRSTVRRFGQILPGTIADGQDVAEWRRVVLAVNGLISVSMEAR